MEDNAEFGCLPFIYRQDIIDQIQPIIAYMGITFIILAIMLDVAIYKWRNLTSFILYFELTYTLLVITIPSTENPTTMIYQFMMNIFLFLLFFTD